MHVNNPKSTLRILFILLHRQRFAFSNVILIKSYCLMFNKQQKKTTVHCECLNIL